MLLLDDIVKIYLFIYLWIFFVPFFQDKRFCLENIF